MVTTTALNEETSEQKAARVKANRAAGLAKARAIKAARNNEDSIFAVPPTLQNTGFAELKNKVWREAFFMVMQNRQVKSVQDLPFCSQLANQVVEELQKQGKL